MIYRGNTILPIDVTLLDPGQPLFASAQVDYMVCQDQCIFAQASVSIDLFTGNAAVGLSEHAPRINAFCWQAGQQRRDGGIGLASHRYDPVRQQLLFDLRSPIGLTALDVLVEAPIEAPGFTFGPASVDYQAGESAALVRVPVEEFAFSGATPSEVPLRLTLVDDKRGVDLGFVDIGTPQGLGTAAHANANCRAICFEWYGGEPVWTGWLVTGVLGGGRVGSRIDFEHHAVCVACPQSEDHGICWRQRQKSRGDPWQFSCDRRRYFARSGKLATMVVLLQTLGTSVGWGFQFQSPWFVGFMVALMVIFAANLFGWFEVPNVPGLAAFGVGRKGPAVDFLTGALATLLGDTLFRPLLGPVIGVAFAGNPATIFGLFTLIGGMAAPYWLVVCFPIWRASYRGPGDGCSWSRSSWDCYCWALPCS